MESSSTPTPDPGTPSSESINATESASFASGATVLVVDDNPHVLDLLSLVFTQCGATPTCVSSGEQALEAFQRETFTVVILDVMMPGMDGYEVATQIRHVIEDDETPIVMLTAKGAQADEARGYLAGVDAYVTKPFDPMQFTQIVQRIMSKDTDTLVAERAARSTAWTPLT